MRTKFREELHPREKDSEVEAEANLE